jgi:hypothetical protein
MNLQGALDLIERDMQSPFKEASTRLAEHLYKHQDEVRHLPYSRIAQIIQSSDPKILLMVTQYCSGSRLKLLQMKFELIIEGDTIPLEDDDIYLAQTHGYLIHPETGNTVENYETVVFPYFIPGEIVSGK